MKLEELVGVLCNCNKTRRHSFNPLEEFHANENAHTRVLVALLKNPDICQSFLRYLKDKFCSAKTWFEDFETSHTKVVCFSDYVDAKITVGKKTAIIENKVNGAEDQDSQIDRYVASTALASSNEDILVIYLTLDGSKTVSEKSFKESRSILGYHGSDSPGRFLAVNYKSHILEWLKSHLLFSVHDLFNQPILYSGIVQYIDYLEGEQCLASRHNETGEDCTTILNRLKSDGLDSAIHLLSEYEKMKVRFIGKILELSKAGLQAPEWNCLPNDERAWVLKTTFCEAFDIAKPDDEFYSPRPNNGGQFPFPNATIAINRWVETSPVQVDFWFGGNCSLADYKTQFKEFQEKLKGTVSLIQRSYEYNDAPAIRFFISNPQELYAFLKVIGGKIGGNPKDTTEEESSVRISLFTSSVENSLRLEEPFSQAVREIAQSDDSKSWQMWKSIEVVEGAVDYTYNYKNGWAIQLSENFSSEMPIRAIEFFPARGTDVSPVVRRLADKRSAYPFRNYRWDGRTVFQFPVDTQEYAQKVCAFLVKFRNDLTV